MSYPNLKVSALLAGQISIDSSWTEDDFAELALAAADQASAGPRDLDAMARMLGLKPLEYVAVLPSRDLEIL